MSYDSKPCYCFKVNEELQIWSRWLGEMCGFGVAGKAGDGANTKWPLELLYVPER